MKQCNECGNRRCQAIQSEYPPVLINGKLSGGMRSTSFYPVEWMQEECKTYLPPVEWKTTLLERMIMEQPDTLKKLLAAFELRVHSKKGYPYFYLHKEI